MDVNKIAALEALLFTAKEAIAIDDIADTIDLTLAETEEYIEVIKKEFNQKRSHGIQLKEYDDKFILATKPHLAPYVKKLHHISKTKNLSQAALETLAIIAYKQPVTRSHIEKIRGVKVEKTLMTLSKYGIIKELGRKDTTGNPIVYGTTEEFLKQFDLNSLSELPDVDDIELEDDFEIENNDKVEKN